MAGVPVLVTGGAGYIGSHACKALAEAGYLPITYDNLSTGWRDAVRFGPLEEGDLADPARLRVVFAAWRPVAVMHFAALSLVGESVADPARYWRANVLSSLTLLEEMAAAGCSISSSRRRARPTATRTGLCSTRTRRSARSTLTEGPSERSRT